MHFAIQGAISHVGENTELVKFSIKETWREQNSNKEEKNKKLDDSCTLRHLAGKQEQAEKLQLVRMTLFIFVSLQLMEERTSVLRR